MRLKEGYELNNIIGEWAVVPIGGRMTDVNGILTLSESGAFLWNKLKTGSDIEKLVSSLLAEYKIDRSTAEEDVRQFIADLNKLGLLEE